LKTTPQPPHPTRQNSQEKEMPDRRSLTINCQNHCQRNHQPTPPPNPTQRQNQTKTSVNGALQTNSSTMTHC
jgi:hypothetical protein